MCTPGQLLFAQCNVGAADYVPPLLLLLVSSTSNVFAAVHICFIEDHSMQISNAGSWSCKDLVLIRLLLTTTHLRNQFFYLLSLSLLLFNLSLPSHHEYDYCIILYPRSIHLHHLLSFYSP